MVERGHHDLVGVDEWVAYRVDGMRPVEIFNFSSVRNRQKGVMEYSYGPFDFCTTFSTGLNHRGAERIMD